MNVNVFLILMLVLIGIVGIVVSLLCTSKRTKNMFLSMFISFALFSVIVISFMVISVVQLYKNKNTNTYNIAIVQVQETDKQDWDGKVIKYTDTTGNENEITISDTKCDADKTYIEIKRYKWWFLYEDENVLHIAISQE